MSRSNLAALATEVLEEARKRSLHIATAESCTGGLVIAALTDIPGSSDVVDRGFVTYSNDAKNQMLGVPAALIASHGAVSQQTARAMAEGALTHSGAELTVAITGVAGPGGGTVEKPVGLVQFAAARKGFPTVTEQHLFGELSRDEIRAKSVNVALQLLLKLARL